MGKIHDQITGNQPRELSSTTTRTWGKVPKGKKPRARPSRGLRDAPWFIHGTLPKYTGPYKVIHRGIKVSFLLILTNSGRPYGYRSPSREPQIFLPHHQEKATPPATRDRARQHLLPCSARFRTRSRPQRSSHLEPGDVAAPTQSVDRERIRKVLRHRTGTCPFHGRNDDAH